MVPSTVQQGYLCPSGFRDSFSEVASSIIKSKEDILSFSLYNIQNPYKLAFKKPFLSKGLHSRANNMRIHNNVHICFEVPEADLEPTETFAL